MTESGQYTNNGLTVYTYDNSGKLTEENGPYADIQYSYDNVGNRLTKTVTGAAASTSATLANGITLVNGTTNYAYDQNDRIISQTGTAPAVTHAYDADGNETTVNRQAASYGYDADGDRTSVSSANPTVNYVVDTSLPYASVVEEYNGTALAARYDYGDDLIRMDRGPVGSQVPSYYLYDGLGSTRQLVNTSGAVTDSYGYSAFGEIASRIGGTTNSFLFNAQQFDGVTGDYYLRAQYYDQSSGRFISQDPYEGNSQDPITLHQYLYAGSDPVSFSDANGEEFSLMGSLTTTIVSTVLGGVLGAATNVGGNRGKATLFGALYGFEGATSIIYASSIGKLGTTILGGFFGAFIAMGVDLIAGQKQHPGPYDIKVMRFYSAFLLMRLRKLLAASWGLLQKKLRN